MKTIRYSVFETNSSSTHSICVVSGDCQILDTMPLEDDICRVYPGEFGWEIEDYYDSASKASYALTYAKSNYSHINQEVLLNKLYKVLLEGTKAKDVQFIPMPGSNIDDGDDWGYIDHQSIEYSGCPMDQTFATEESLKAFIFNTESLLHTDNDNH